jgi:hypothetical protein
MPNKVNAFIKGVLLVIGGYIITIWTAVFIISIAIMLLLNTSNCSVMGRALVVLWITIAGLFLASVIMVRFLARKIIPPMTGRWIIPTVHGMVLFSSYVVIAFVLMVAFNC